MIDGYGDFLKPRGVTPKYISGMNMSWNLNIFSGPKLYIECGKCSAGFYFRAPRKNYPTVACTNCGTINEIPLVYE